MFRQAQNGEVEISILRTTDHLGSRRAECTDTPFPPPLTKNTVKLKVVAQRDTARK